MMNFLYKALKKLHFNTKALASVFTLFHLFLRIFS